MAELNHWMERAIIMRNRFEIIATVLREDCVGSDGNGGNRSTDLIGQKLGKESLEEILQEPSEEKRRALQEMSNLRVESLRRDADLKKLRMQARTAVETKDAAQTRLADLYAERAALKSRATQLIERARADNGEYVAEKHDLASIPDVFSDELIGSTPTLSIAASSDNLIGSRASMASTANGQGELSTNDLIASTGSNGTAHPDERQGFTSDMAPVPGLALSSLTMMSREVVTANGHPDSCLPRAHSVETLSVVSLPRRVRFDDRLQESPRVLKQPAPPESSSELARSMSPILKHGVASSKHPITNPGARSSPALSASVSPSVSPTAYTPRTLSPRTLSPRAVSTTLSPRGVATTISPRTLSPRVVSSVASSIATLPAYAPLLPAIAALRSEVEKVGVPAQQPLAATGRQVDNLIIKQSGAPAGRIQAKYACPTGVSQKVVPHVQAVRNATSSPKV